MLERPSLADEKIAACLRDEYGLQAAEIVFLPLGADQYTAVFRVDTTDNVPYFVKLRSGIFDTIAVDVPKFLYDQGISYIIPIIPAQSGDLSVRLDEFNLILYPFIEGQGGFDKDLSDHDWIVFGRALKSIHAITLPSELAARIPRELYSPKWREQVKHFQARAENETFADSVSAALAELLKTKQAQINHLINRAEDLGAVLQHQPANHILCHSDIHVGNILMSTRVDKHYIVDWDQPILAPKERDLMFVGGGLGGGGHIAEQEEALFYEGYGQTQINPVALAYYRYERIVQDISAYCEQIWLPGSGDEDRQQGLQYLTSTFLPGDVIDMAYRTERLLPPELRSHWN